MVLYAEHAGFMNPDQQESTSTNQGGASPVHQTPLDTLEDGHGRHPSVIAWLIVAIMLGGGLLALAILATLLCAKQRIPLHKKR